MLKNGSAGYNRLFQIIIGYYNGISNFRCLVVCVCVFFEARDYRKMIFSESPPIYIWVLAGHEVGALNIQARSFNSYLILQAFY